MHHSHFIYPTMMHGPTAPIPVGKGVLHCRATTALVAVTDPQEELPGSVWQFPPFACSSRQTLWLRLVPAVDVRTYTSITVYSAQSGQYLCGRALGLPSVFEPLDVPLPDGIGPVIAKEGIRLVLTGPQPLHVFVQQGRATDGGVAVDVLSSGLVVQSSGMQRQELVNALETRLCSAGAWTEWSWHGGCVLDGLWALQQTSNTPQTSPFASAIERYFDAFMTDYDLVSFSPHSEMLVNEVAGVEGGLPWATLLRVRPEHPVVELFATFMTRYTVENQQRHHYTCEGNYTFTYPMMVLGLTRNREDWINQAWDNLRNWQDALRQHDGLYLRNHNGTLTYRNWARGCCWYVMGLTRCLEAAQAHGLELPDDLLDELNDVLSWLLAQQRTDGLWSNFIDEQAQAPDTSGSAGIATAMTLASHYGWLDDVTGVSFQQAASHTFDTLLHYLTADGYLTGVAPNNKGEGGITLQRQPYRATMQFATGLMGSLLAAQRKAGMTSTDMLD